MAYLIRPHALKATSTYIGGVQLGTKVQDSGPCHVSTESSDCYNELIMKSHTRLSMLTHSHSSYTRHSLDSPNNQAVHTMHAAYYYYNTCIPKLEMGLCVFAL